MDRAAGCRPTALARSARSRACSSTVTSSPGTGRFSTSRPRRKTRWWRRPDRAHSSLRTWRTGRSTPAALGRPSPSSAGNVDAVLFGDSGWARVQLSPAYRASVIAAEGMRPWAGLNCRDRNRVALEGELAALADIGAAVHCVTGDHTAIGHRPEARAVFDLDSTELASLARSAGVLVSVAENPVAPPIEHPPRAPRGEGESRGAGVLREPSGIGGADT